MVRFFRNKQLWKVILGLLLCAVRKGLFCLVAASVRYYIKCNDEVSNPFKKVAYKSLSPLAVKKRTKRQV